MDRPIGVALIEDDRPFRSSIEMLLESTLELRPVAGWGSVAAALSSELDAPPDVVLLDLGLPDIAGEEGVGEVSRRWPQAAVLIFSASFDEERIFAAIRRGASGYLLKGTPPGELIDSLVAAGQGGATVSPGVARELLDHLRSLRGGLRGLTADELQVLERLAEGQPLTETPPPGTLTLTEARRCVRSVLDKLHRLEAG